MALNRDQKLFRKGFSLNKNERGNLFIWQSPNQDGVIISINGPDGSTSIELSQEEWNELISDVRYEIRFKGD